MFQVALLAILISCDPRLNHTIPAIVASAEDILPESPLRPAVSEHPALLSLKGVVLENP